MQGVRYVVELSFHNPLDVSIDVPYFLQATVLLALLQPAPETYELFDDILLLSEGVTAACPALPPLLPLRSAKCKQVVQMRRWRRAGHAL